VTWQPGSESNRQPLVLETSALPVELPGSILVAGADLRHTSTGIRLLGHPRFPIRASACAFTKRLRSNLITDTPCRRRFRAGKRMRLASVPGGVSGLPNRCRASKDRIGRHIGAWSAWRITIAHSLTG
jgi:hypothetical protein